MVLLVFKADLRLLKFIITEQPAKNFAWMFVNPKLEKSTLRFHFNFQTLKVHIIVPLSSKHLLVTAFYKIPCKSYSLVDTMHG